MLDRSTGEVTNLLNPGVPIWEGGGIRRAGKIGSSRQSGGKMKDDG